MPITQPAVAASQSALAEQLDRYRELADAAYAVVELMDKPIVGDAKQAAKAWRAATRLCKVLNRHHGAVQGS